MPFPAVAAGGYFQSIFWLKLTAPLVTKPVRLRLLCGLLLKVVFPASGLAQPARFPLQPKHQFTATDVAPESCSSRALAD